MDVGGRGRSVRPKREAKQKHGFRPVTRSRIETSVRRCWVCPCGGVEVGSWEGWRSWRAKETVQGTGRVAESLRWKRIIRVNQPLSVKMETHSARFPAFKMKDHRSDLVYKPVSSMFAHAD